MIIGVLSDTHGTLHSRVLPLFTEAGVELILHAGDVGSFDIIETLSRVAPVHAVCGNVDVSGNVALLPGELRLEIKGATIYMTHIGGKPSVWASHLPKPRPDMAICGHSHIALLEQLGSTLFLNPGAAGTQPRFGAPLSAALLRVEGGQVSAELVVL